MSRAEYRAALERAADWFDKRDRPIEAANAAIALGDMDRLADLIQRESTRLLAQGRARTLADWFDRLPSTMLPSNPGLQARRAQLEVELGNLPVAYAMFESAVDRLLGNGERSAAADALRVMAGAMELSGDYVRAREALTRVLELVPDADLALGIRVRNQLSSLKLRAGDANGAVAVAREVVERAAALDDPLPRAVAYNNLGHMLDAVGRLHAAEQAFRHAVELKRRHGFDASLSITLNSLGVLYHHQGRLPEAESTLAEAVQLAERHGAAVIQAYALSNLGDVLRDRGDLDAARVYFARSLEQKEQLGSPFALAHTWNSLAALWRQAGDLRQASEYNARALALRTNEAEPVERLLYRAEAGRIALAEGRFAEAQEQLAEIARELWRLAAGYHAFRAQWWAAVAGWRHAGVIDPDFEMRLRESETAAEPPLFDTLVAESPAFAVAAWSHGCGGAALRLALGRQHERVLPEIAAALREASPQRAHAARLVDLLPHLPGNAPLQLLSELDRQSAAEVRSSAKITLSRLRSAPAPRLDVIGFGGLRVSRRGALVPERAWRRQRSMELLGLLLLAGPGGRPRDELIADLWPEASPDAGVDQFHTHLRALRTALEPEAAPGVSRYVLGEGRTYRLAFELVQTWDVQQFEDAVARGLAAEAQGAAPEAMQAFELASGLGEGALFAGLTPEGDWLEIAGEHFHQLAADIRVRLARLRESAGDPIGACEAWRSVLRLDPVREDAHRGLMRLLRGLGQRDAALAQFRHCVDLLQRDLLQPSPETVALYRQVASA